MFIPLTKINDTKSEFFNMDAVERIEARNRGAALFYPLRSRPTRVAESPSKIQKLMRSVR